MFSFCVVFCVLANEAYELSVSEISNLKRTIEQETFEKDAALKSSTDFRNMVKKSEGEKLELNRINQELKQKISGTSEFVSSMTAAFQAHCITIIIIMLHQRLAAGLLKDGILQKVFFVMLLSVEGQGLRSHHCPKQRVGVIQTLVK